MRAKPVAIFVLAILIPTALLAYFGLLAVRSEKSILEKTMHEKYRAIADIIEGEITSALNRISGTQVYDTEDLEALLFEQASLFKGEAFIFDQKGRAVGDEDVSLTLAPVYTQPLKNLPYSISVFEQHPLILERLEEKKKGLNFYIGVIISSAFLILAGAFLTLQALAKEWRFAQLKSEFVSQLSHDLRKPLTSIRMFAEMLKEGRIPSEDKKQSYYAIISHESVRLTHLANNILDFSRIESGRIDYHFQKENLSLLVRDVVERFRTYMIDGSRTIGLDIQDPCPDARINSDAISQALMNLLSNADKYSPTRKPIQVNLMRRHREAIIQVIDQGTGIAKPDQKKIFQRFYRVSSDAVARIEGSGLGLSLVHYAALAHHGRVALESEKGKGSTFSLILPYG
jgi:signal transduction histidine kinase